MKLENTFRIPVPVERAWPVLLDIERIAPCVPGAVLTGKDGDDYRGKIKVKLGPVGLSYNGTIKVRSADDDAKVAVLEGGGREARGNGTAKAVITCRMVETDGSTDVFVDTELDITGKPAQFGRGTLAEVAGTLIGQFAANLAEEITSASTDVPADQTGETAPKAHADTASDNSAASTTDAEIRSITPPRKAAEPIDLLDAAGVGGLKRFGPPALAALLLLAIIALLRRRHNER